MFNNMHPYRARLQREVVKTKEITKWRLTNDTEDRLCFFVFAFITLLVYFCDFLLGNCTAGCFVAGDYIYGALMLILTAMYAAMSFMLPLFLKLFFSKEKVNKEYYVLE